MTSETGGAHYTYRADGMRTQKVTDCSYSWYYDEINDSSFYDEVTTVNKPTTRYFYDGQMACEEDFAELVPSEDPFFEVTRYGLGARGIDWIEKATVEDTSISFPIYDGHGNVIAQLGRTGSSYSLTQVKKYDVWGGVRSGALGPAGRYCGNLGHVSDDESGLIYMRARYYEPGNGRFISEDPAMDGTNWFAYCGNDAVGNVDPSGRETEDAFSFVTFLAVMYYATVPVPYFDNPWLAKALNVFAGFTVSSKWQDRLKSKVDPYFAYTGSNILTILGLTLLKGMKVATIGGWVVMYHEARNLQHFVALVGCDMAFEDGL